MEVTQEEMKLLRFTPTQLTPLFAHSWLNVREVSIVVSGGWFVVDKGLSDGEGKLSAWMTWDSIEWHVRICD